MFFGETAINLDAKGRLAVPMRYRDDLKKQCENRLVLTYSAFDSGVLWLYLEEEWQRIRDEVHRFAIGSHRAKRAKSMTKSVLEDVPGIGPKRKNALLQHFGSAKSVADAALHDLEAAQGISKTFAQKIYDHFHSTT